MKRRPHRKDGIRWLAWFIFRSKWHFFSLRERNDQRRHTETIRLLSDLAKRLRTIDLHTSPPIDGLEDLLAGNTPVQRAMFIAGFRLVKAKMVKTPYAAATRVFKDFQRRAVNGRYENLEAFCTQFARKWKNYNERPRL